MRSNVTMHLMRTLNERSRCRWMDAWTRIGIIIPSLNWVANVNWYARQGFKHLVYSNKLCFKKSSVRLDNGLNCYSLQVCGFSDCQNNRISGNPSRTVPCFRSFSDERFNNFCKLKKGRNKKQFQLSCGNGNADDEHVFWPRRVNYPQK